MNHSLRYGKFTSSEIYNLTTSGRQEFGFGAPAITYIKEKRLERLLGRSLDVGAYSRAMAWGLFLEQRVLNMIGLEYQLISNETKTHPKIDCWAGSQDLLVAGKKISDIKCYQPKHFAEYALMLAEKDVVRFKSEFPKEYWQLVSNAIINGVKNAEAIAYMPYQSELAEIRDMAMNHDGPDLWKYRFIYEESDENLAYLPDDGYFKNLNVFEFEVPEQDIADLTERVEKARLLLEGGAK